VKTETLRAIRKRLVVSKPRLVFVSDPLLPNIDALLDPLFKGDSGGKKGEKVISSIPDEC